MSTKFKKTMYVDTYILASQGHKRNQIAENLGISYPNFLKWMKKYPALQDAYDRGRANHGGTDSKDPNFMDYVYMTLPPKLKKLWNEINALDKKKEGNKIEILLRDKGDRIRQQLFLHALVTRHFNPSKAMRAVNVSPGTYNRWLNDPNFEELVKQVHQHRKEFFQECLVKKAKKGDTNAIIFANRTLNRDLGYGDKSELEITGSLNHRHENLINLSEIGLPIELQKQIMHHIRLHREKQADGPVLEYAKREDGVFAPKEEENERVLQESD